MGEDARSGRGRGGGGDPVLRQDERARLRGGIDVWIAAVDLADTPAEAARCRAVVTPEELAACGTFHHEADRRRALVTRAMVRIVLSRYDAAPPGEWRFTAGPHGRPEIGSPAATRLRFNLAHTRELVACAVAESADVGVDVERVAAHPDMERLAESVMSDDELAAFLEVPETSRPQRFALTWTLKESYLKARGLGLSLPPRAISFDLSAPGGIGARCSPAAGDDSAAWWFASWDEHPDHVVSTALRTGGAPGRVRVLRLVSFDGRAEAAERLLRKSR